MFYSNGKEQRIFKVSRRVLVTVIVIGKGTGNNVSYSGLYGMQSHEPVALC